MTELKPCPFCGGKAEFRYLKYASYIFCSRCHVLVGVDFCFSESQDEEKIVTEAWNRRVGENNG